MKWLKMVTLLSLLTLWLITGCTTETTTEPEATTPVNEPTIVIEPATSQPTLAPETAVPSPTTESTRTIRLTPAATPQQIEIVPTLEAAATVGEVPEDMMRIVLEDLTTAENISKEAIIVTRAEAIIWGDGSLGCPQPDQAYTTVNVPGYWIMLEANGRTYDYHAAETGYFILCQNNPPLPPAVGTPTS